ncbi:hypothetical protein NTGZN8_60009 [Candidatus Nitrotoga fabula]|uniref:Uncharacterized protein n=1 Tax=Candidatus Nitrotoga fabula TaxID=2182327 RepID=A0A916FCJ0_9PROT|nr:hypothetical protein NTGZN8_60009 [Candidatus Nitrotoga fabula]
MILFLRKLQENTFYAHTLYWKKTKF